MKKILIIISILVVIINTYAQETILEQEILGTNQFTNIIQACAVQVREMGTYISVQNI